MKTRLQRTIRIELGRVSYDLVLTATADMGVMKLAGTGAQIDPATGGSLRDLGPVDTTVWGATVEQLRMRAKSWPPEFNRVTGDYFGVSRADEHRFDIFLVGDRFMRLLDLAHGSRHGVLTVRCDLSQDGEVDLVREIEISAARG
jgi:hypothetical protein